MLLGAEYEKSHGRQVCDVHEQNLAHDVTNLGVNSVDLHMLEVKGLAATGGAILLSPMSARSRKTAGDCY